MGNWLFEIILGKVARSIDGYKMYIVGTSFVLKGILGLIGHYWPDTGIPGDSITTATNEIMAGLGAFAGKSAIVKSGSKL